MGSNVVLGIGCVVVGVILIAIYYINNRKH